MSNDKKGRNLGRIVILSVGSPTTNPSRAAAVGPWFTLAHDGPFERTADAAVWIKRSAPSGDYVIARFSQSVTVAVETVETRNVTTTPMTPAECAATVAPLVTA